MSIRGSLDVVTTSGAVGWAYSPELKNSLTVQALLNHSVIGEAIANNYRPDLAEVGLGDGNCGYNITFYNKIDSMYLPFVVVKPEGSDLEFPRSTTSGFGDFLRRLYERYPATGRYRSVFGGLWTDRVDAAAILKGRCEIGMINRDIEQKLSRFIQSSLLIMDGVAPSLGKPISRAGKNGGLSHASVPPETDLAEVLSAVLQSSNFLGVLHAILEDHPLVLTAKRVTEDRQFCQPSATETLQSPGECVAVVVPFPGCEIELNVVRDSHLFPEFTPNGRSRWTELSGSSAIEMACRWSGIADRYKVPFGSVALIGPGLIHGIRVGHHSGALYCVCIPSRQTPVARVASDSLKEIALESGARIWV